MLTAERKAALMAYCRIDELEPGEESVLEMLHSAATAYLQNAGVSEPPEGSLRRGQYDFVTNALILDAWENRGVQIHAAGFSANPILQRMITQLKLTEPVPDSGTGVGG